MFVFFFVVFFCGALLQLAAGLSLCLILLNTFLLCSMVTVALCSLSGGEKSWMLFGSIVYNRTKVYMHQNFLKVVVHVIIIHQRNQTAPLYEIQIGYL